MEATAAAVVTTMVAMAMQRAMLARTRRLRAPRTAYEGLVDVARRCVGKRLSKKLINLVSM